MVLFLLLFLLLFLFLLFPTLFPKIRVKKVAVKGNLFLLFLFPFLLFLFLNKRRPKKNCIPCSGFPCIREQACGIQQALCRAFRSAVFFPFRSPPVFLFLKKASVGSLLFLLLFLFLPFAVPFRPCCSFFCFLSFLLLFLLFPYAVSFSSAHCPFF